MATQPTNLPVPSESPRDLKSNAGKIDEFVTSRELKYIDRFGGEHYTIEGISKLSKEAISSFGYITMDSFEDGNTLTLPNQVLRLEATGEYYRWDGAFPKVVPAASTPESTGGIGLGKWLSVGDATLRGELADVNSDISIAGVPASQVGGNATNTKYLEAPDVYDLIVTYGQSNSAGEAILSGDTSGFPNPLPKSLMYDFTDGTIKPIIQSMVSSSGVASSGHAWGEFSNEWYRQSGHGAVIVHCGRGATSISQLSKGNSAGFYSLLLDGVAKTKAQMTSQGMTLGKVYVLFHQGETDMIMGTTFDDYRQMMVDLIDNLAADIRMTRFANCTVGCPRNRPEASWATIQNAQRYVCAGRDVAVTAFDGCPAFLYRDGNVGTEGVHYTQKGYNTMGFNMARGLWSSESGATKSKTSADFAQYNPSVAGWSRAKHCAASARFAGSTREWTLLNIANDTKQMRISNIDSVSVAEDGNSFLFSVADRADHWFDFKAGIDHRSALEGFEVYAEPINIGKNYNLRLAVYLSTTILVNVKTGEIRYGVPAGVPPYWLSSIIKSSGGEGAVVLKHPAVKAIPQATYYAPATAMTDVAPFVGIYCPDIQTTRVYGSGVSNSPWAAVSLKKMLISPVMLANFACTVSVSGTYAPEF